MALPPQIIAQHLQRAVQAIQQGQPGQVEAILAPVAKEKSARGDVLHLRGMAAKALGDLPGARKLLRDAVKAAPGNPEPQSNLGNVESALGNHADAIRAYEAALRLKPDFAQAAVNLSVCLVSAERFERAETAARAALKLAPQATAAWNVLGRSLRALGRHEEALTAFDRSLALNQNNLNAHYYKALTLIDAGREAEAEQILRMLSTQAPAFSAGHFALANLLRDARNYDEAITLYQKSLAADPAFEDGHYNLNQLLWMKGDRDRFLESYRTAMAAHPENIAIRMNFAFRLYQAERYDEAREVLSALDTPDRNPDAATLLGLIAMENHDFEAARRIFDAALKHAPDHVNLRKQRAVASIQLGDGADAERRLTRLAREVPLDQHCIGLWASALQAAGDERFHTICDVDRIVGTQLIRPPATHDTLDTFMEDLRAQLRSMHEESWNAPLDQSLRGGTQIESEVFDTQIPVLAGLKQAIIDAVDRFIAGLPDDPDHPFLRRKPKAPFAEGGWDFSGAWSVRLRQSGFHVDHVHPEGWISSAFYAELPASVTSASSNGAGWIKFNEPGFPMAKKPVPGYYVRPQEGLLCLFPSYMWHGTVPFEDEAARMTVAFDVVPKK